MAYVVSSLPAYTNEPEKIIYEKLFTGSPTMEICKGNMQTGIKSAETINILNTEFVLQAQSCALNPSGSTTFTQRTLTVGKMKIDGSFCERDLEPKFTQKAMQAGGNYDSLTYNTEIVDSSLNKVAKRMATAVWKGDTASVDQYLLHFNGLIKTLNADIPAANKYSGTTWNETNARAALKAFANLIIQNQDVYMGGNTTIQVFCSPANKAVYRWALIAANLFSVNAADPNQKLFIEGTNIELVEDIGLAGLHYFYAIEPENIVAGTDMENEQEKVDVWFSKDDQKIYLHAEWKFAVNVAFEGRCFSYLGV